LIKLEKVGGFEVLEALTMKSTGFCDVTSWGVENHFCFSQEYSASLFRRGDIYNKDGGSLFF
jgi:hypothetical protein